MQFLQLHVPNLRKVSGGELCRNSFFVFSYLQDSDEKEEKNYTYCAIKLKRERN
jgi:hypothetical protein